MAKRMRSKPGRKRDSFSFLLAGNREDYDRWAELGNVGWSYEDVLPYFKRSEDMLEPEAASDKEHHSTGGPLSVEHAGNKNIFVFFLTLMII